MLRQLVDVFIQRQIERTRTDERKLRMRLQSQQVDQLISSQESDGNPGTKTQAIEIDQDTIDQLK